MKKLTSNPDRLGDFVREFELEGATFYLRGLTVGEYADLVDLTDMESSLSKYLYVQCGIAGLLGWSELVIDGEYVECDGLTADCLDNNTLITIGKKVYHDLSTLTEEEQRKFKGFVRMMFWRSDNPKRAQNYDCETCLEKGLATGRPCGKFDMDYRANYNSETDEEVKKKRQRKKRSDRRRNKYSKKKTYVNKYEFDAKKKAPEEKGVIVLNKFKFPECPTSWIDGWVQVIGSALYHAEMADQNFFSGGVADQLNRLHRASKIIKSEVNKIEREEHEKSMKDK